MTARVRVIEWADQRMPALARALSARSVPGAVARTGPLGVEWTPGDVPTRSLVVYLTPSESTSRWLAGSLAVRLGSTVLVAASLDDPAASLASAIESRSLDGARVAVVAESTGALAAIEACSSVSVSRLALLYPPAILLHGDQSESLGRLPTTLLQASAGGEGRGAIVQLDWALREAGVAVRETEYDSIADGWARHPKAVSGAKRALDDLVAFLERGFGVQSTFEVIPGWDLH